MTKTLFLKFSSRKTIFLLRKSRRVSPIQFFLDFKENEEENNDRRIDGKKKKGEEEKQRILLDLKLKKKKKLFVQQHVE